LHTGHFTKIKDFSVYEKKVEKFLKNTTLKDPQVPKIRHFQEL
jgi:hypothetical protein